ncbi:DUF4153 domain-containing protein [Phytomonospora endophytica]|uniref:DUF4173 domain-containing protein n=1 Tax=Phytomonospora endophytica TaxID=714109 RepID=A0A841F8B6_9ACTN|nr:DUF4173 domain-containing protein [Phytomonospora endophytica]MBB6032466.1 hypothetical protein [Phytomonospora endophytica]GIG66386.1 hypothetical protein Pen01_26810 [Phytomonospora endophytica]
MTTPQIPPHAEPGSAPWHGTAPELRGKIPMATVPYVQILPQPPDPVTAFFRRLLPTATTAAPRWALAALAATALLAAFAFTSGDPGVGITLTGIGLLAATLPLARRDQPVTRAVGAVIAVALFLVPSLRDNEALVAICVLIGFGAIAATLAPPIRFAGFLYGPFLAAVLWLPGLSWARRGIADLPGRRSAMLILRTAVIATVVVVVFGALFASADPAFAELVETITPTMSPGLAIGRTILFLFFLTGGFAYAHLAVRPARLDLIGARPARKVRLWEWAVPLTLLNALFAAFVAVQAVAFFGGAAYVARTTGLTYAEYARRGFWQLCWVTVLTLAVIAVAARKAPRAQKAERLILRVLLGALCALSLVVVASALHRMSLYEDMYGLTRLRVWIFTVELWLGLVFLLVMVAGIRLRARWLPRTVAATGAVALIALAVLNPDGLIAQRNADHYAKTGKLDIEYLTSLSTDVVPGLDGLPAFQRADVLDGLACFDDQDDLLAWNLSRSLAADARPGHC